MSLLDVIFRRRSIRQYKDTPVSDSVLNSILEAGRLAPSADNEQPWHFIVATDPQTKGELSKGPWRSFIKDSAFTIIGCGEKNSKWSTVDVAIALENMVLAAEAQNVGSCWIGAFEEGEVKKLLGIPDNIKVVAMVAFGYPAEKLGPSKKKNLESIVHYNRF
jgi:nitroreductase